MYRVTSHVGSACGTDAPVDVPYAYVRMSSGDGYSMEACESPIADTCTKVAVFPDPIDDDGWRERAAAISIITETSECRRLYRDAAA